VLSRFVLLQHWSFLLLLLLLLLHSSSIPGHIQVVNRLLRSLATADDRRRSLVGIRNGKNRTALECARNAASWSTAAAYVARCLEERYGDDDDDDDSIYYGDGDDESSSSDEEVGEKEQEKEEEEEEEEEEEDSGGDGDDTAADDNSGNSDGEDAYNSADSDYTAPTGSDSDQEESGETG